MPDDNPQSTHINETHAARIIGVSRDTLRRWRNNGQAPPCYEYPAGAIRYKREEVEAWKAQFRREAGTPPTAKGPLSDNEAPAAEEAA